jgi:SPP1 family predicted phage head-tail adaptor
MPRIGSLNKRLSLEEETGTQNTLGEVVPVWVAIKELWGSIEPIRGRELLASDTRFAEVDTRIRVHFDEAIQSDMRLTRDGKIYTILYTINPREMNRELELLCTEGARD